MVTDIEGQVLLSQHVNVLMVGSNADVEAMLADVMPYAYADRCPWPDVSKLRPGVACTVVVRDVTERSAADWQSLHDFMNQTICPVQILSTARSDVFEAVERGAFPASLYYRLNVILLGRPDTGPCAGTTSPEQTLHPTRP